MKKEEVLEWLVLVGKDWVSGFTVYERVKCALAHTEDMEGYNITKWNRAGYILVDAHDQPNIRFKLTDKALKLLEE